MENEYKGAWGDDGYLNLGHKMPESRQLNENGPLSCHIQCLSQREIN